MSKLKLTPYERDTVFLETYFDVVEKLLDPKTGRPKNRDNHAIREDMRRNLTRIRIQRLKEEYAE